MKWPIGANKIFSVRAWVTIIFVVTLCLITNKALDAFICNLTNKETFDGAKEVCMKPNEIMVKNSNCLFFRGSSLGFRILRNTLG
jgi:hypothetical protein